MYNEKISIKISFFKVKFSKMKFWQDSDVFIYILILVIFLKKLFAVYVNFKRKIEVGLSTI